MDKPNNSNNAPNRQDIQVRRIYFTKALDIPGKHTTEAVEAQNVTNAKRWEIVYQPWMRHHRITYYAPGNKTPEIAFVHESCVAMWLPVNPL